MQKKETENLGHRRCTCFTLFVKSGLCEFNSLSYNIISHGHYSICGKYLGAGFNLLRGKNVSNKI
jgi:hypothetical protein